MLISPPIFCILEKSTKKKLSKKKYFLTVRTVFYSLIENIFFC